MKRKIKARKVKVGDRIIGADGKPAQVTEISPMRGLLWFELAGCESGALAPDETVVKA